MTTIYEAAGSGQAIILSQRFASLFRSLWDAFWERRRRQQVHASLSDLSDRELMDIGTTRGEIDYVAANRSLDPRDIRAAGLGA